MSRARKADAPFALTPREEQVAKLLAQGKNRKEIEAALGIKHAHSIITTVREKQRTLNECRVRDFPIRSY